MKSLSWIFIFLSIILSLETVRTYMQINGITFDLNESETSRLKESFRREYGNDLLAIENHGSLPQNRKSLSVAGAKTLQCEPTCFKHLLALGNYYSKLHELDLITYNVQNFIFERGCKTTMPRKGYFKMNGRIYFISGNSGFSFGNEKFFLATSINTNKKEIKAYFDKHEEEMRKLEQRRKEELDRAKQVRNAALKRAEQVRNEALKRAEQVRNAAQKIGEEVRNAAQKRGEEVRNAALKQAEQVRNAAQKRGKEVRNAALKQAEQVRNAALKQAAGVTKEAFENARKSKTNAQRAAQVIAKESKAAEQTIAKATGRAAKEMAKVIKGSNQYLDDVSENWIGEQFFSESEESEESESEEEDW